MRFIEQEVRVAASDVVAPVLDRCEPPAPYFLSLNGRAVEVTRDAWRRSWFICPGCGVRRRHLFLPDLLCRVCLDLRYSIQYGEAYALSGALRAARLRRSIGAPAKLFSPIPRQPRARGRIRKIMRRIMDEEAALLAQLSDFNDKAEARLARSCNLSATRADDADH